jgi:hypothetical protein
MPDISNAEIKRRQLVEYKRAGERPRCACCVHIVYPKRCSKHSIQVDSFSVCKDFDESPLRPLKGPVIEAKNRHVQERAAPNTGKNLTALFGNRKVVQIRAVDAPPVQLPDDELSTTMKQWGALAPDEELKEHSREYEQRMATRRLNAMLSGLPPV